MPKTDYADRGETHDPVCGAVWTDGNGYTHICDRLPHGDGHLHAENSHEVNV
jgi:hypothetical protein